MTKHTIRKGTFRNDLYIFDTWVPKLVACANVVSPFDEHCRDWISISERVKKLCPKLDDFSTLNYESYKFVKHHRTHLSPKINKQVKSAFELVYSDILGSSPIMAKLEFRYFVTFVDDFSRMTWIYFMRSRSNVFSHFCAFCVEVKAQFNVSVRILSDNAKEYLLGSFQNYMT